MALFANSGNISKFIVAVAGAVGTALQVDFGSSKWAPLVIAAISALTVYLVPNTDSAAQLAEEEAEVENVAELVLADLAPKPPAPAPADRVAELRQVALQDAK